MALHTLALTGTLPCLAGWVMPQVGGAITPADIAAIEDGGVDDYALGAILQGYSAGATACICTGTTHGTTSITAVTKRAGAQYPVPITQIRPGDLVLGIGITPGTFVLSSDGAGNVTLSQACASNTTGVALLFVRSDVRMESVGPRPNGLLYFPNGRGALKMLPGDVAATDNTGFPYLISGNAIGYAGSQWTFT